MSFNAENELHGRITIGHSHFTCIFIYTHSIQQVQHKYALLLNKIDSLNKISVKLARKRSHALNISL